LPWEKPLLQSNNPILKIDKKREFELANICAQSWFPYFKCLSNEALLDNTIKHDKILKELRCDLSLYSYCLKQSNLNQDFTIKEKKSGLAKEFLEKATLFSHETVKQILENSKDEISKYTLETLSEAQVFILKFSLISAHAAALMAERADENPHSAFSLAMLRCLPVILLSWSFPAVLSKAVISHKEGFSPIIEVIEEFLNIVYVDFCSILYKRLAIPDEVRDFLSTNLSEVFKDSAQGLPEIKNRDSKVDSILRFSLISEELARLSHPEMFPLAGAAWQITKKEFEYFLGKHGIKVLNEKLSIGSKGYAQFDKSAFMTELDPDRDLVVATRFFNTHRFNRAVKDLELGEDIKETLLTAYQLMGYRTSSPEALTCLFHDVLPEIGFERGCVYLLDQTKKVLNARYTTKDKQSSFFKIVNISSSGEIPQLIFDALQARDPVRLERFYSDTLTGCHIAWRFGSISTGGVLYLEAGQFLRQKPMRVINNYFLAAHRCVKDALNM
jgi:hypothetical protein